jgi:hypothetical protein
VAEPALKLEVTSGEGQPVEVDVLALDAPGPSGYGLFLKARAARTLPPTQPAPPEIDGLTLRSKPTLLAFLSGVVAGQSEPVTVLCLRPRLARIRELLDAAADEMTIPVPLNG